MINKYDEYIKQYNELCEKLEKQNVSDEIFSDLMALCDKALKIDLVEVSKNIK